MPADAAVIAEAPLSLSVAGAATAVEEPVSAELLARLAIGISLHARLDDNHYELLGIEPSATTKDIRKAYFKLSKQCHPDVFFRQPIGAYRKQLEVVFDRLTSAYETLKSSDRRAEYNTARGILPSAPKPIAAAATAMPSAASLPQPTRHSVRPPHVESERERAERALKQRERLLRELKTPSQAKLEVPVAVAAADPPTGTRNSQAAKEALARELTRRSRDPGRNSGVGTGGQLGPLLALATALELEGGRSHAWAAARLRDAHSEEEAGHLIDAVNLLRIIGEKVSDPRILIEAERLNRAMVRRTAPILRARARDAEKGGDFRAAATDWKKLVSGYPEDGEAHLQAALALLKADQLREAGRYALRAAELLPDAAQPREVLIAFFEASGMQLNAKRERAALKRILNAAGA